MLSALWHGWQSWKSARGVAVLATLALAVGIGSATAIYTVVNGVMLKPLPYAHADRFVALYGGRTTEPNRRSAHAFPDLVAYQERTNSFDVFGWLRSRSFNLTFEGQPQHVVGAAVTASLAHNLGVNPMLGRWFSDDKTAVISNALWRRFGADPAIVGKALTLDGATYSISGVMPAAFRLPVPGPGVDPTRSDVWIPLDPLDKSANPQAGYYIGYARLKPGVTLAQAEQDMKRVAAEIAPSKPEGETFTARVDDLRAAVVIEIKPTLILLAIAAGVLLLIACADVAGLLLARAVTRTRETAIRIALGASRRQLATQYFTEGLIVSLAGAAAGILVCVLLVRFVVSIAFEFIPRADEIAIDWRALLFAASIGIAASGLASLAPLWQASRTVPGDALGDGVRATAGRGSRRLARSLVVAEIALAFTLLTGSVVLIFHLRHLAGTSPGFDPEHVLTFRATSARTWDNADRRVEWERRVISALEGVPGVTSAAFTNQIPLDGCCFSTTVFAEGRTATAPVAERTNFVVVTPGYFRTMQIPLRRGRYIDERDTNESLVPIAINETAARMHWPGGDAVGARGRFAGASGTPFQVVGVVGDVRNETLGKPPVPEVYLLHALFEVTPMRFVVRSALPAETLVADVRRAIQAVDPGQPIYNVSTMTDIIRSSMSFERVGSMVTAFFALTALLMASLGIYGVVSYFVRQSTVELGTRMALGASGHDLLLLVVGGGLKMAGYGAIIGGVAVAASAFMLVRVFEIPDLGVGPFLLSAAVVGAVTTAATLVPGWRATRVSPMVAIRNDAPPIWDSAGAGLRGTLRSLTRVLTDDGERAHGVDAEVIAAFVQAARGASSFAEAFQAALATLRDRIRASTIVLLENVGGELCPLAAAPDSARVDAPLPADGFLANRLRFYNYPLPLTNTDLESWLHWSYDTHSAYAAEVEVLRSYGARMAVPLRAKAEMLGVLLLGTPADGDQYSPDVRNLLRQCAEQLTLMIENARLTSRVVEQEKLRRDVALAAEVQKRLLPERPPVTPAADLVAVTMPARTVGGDYYDFLELGENRIGIALADVAGKGVPAALVMAVVQASLRVVAADGETPLPELAARINALLHRSTGSNSYATFFYAQLDERSRQLRYVNAGHNPPYLVRTADRPDLSATSTAEIRELSIGGTVLGLFPQMSYEEATVDLRPGDVLVAFTDGVTEALNRADEEYGNERLKHLLGKVLHLSAAEISARISEELRTWISDAAQHDDLTFVVMKVN